MTYSFKSGTEVIVNDNSVEIIRMDSKSAAKALFAGRTMGKMVIKKSAITGLIYFSDYLFVCASGLPSPTDFKISSVADIKQFPNCIVAKPEELEQLYNDLASLISK